MEPTQFERAVLNFSKELEDWLKEGGDKRLKEFTPLGAFVHVMQTSRFSETAGMKAQ